MSDLPLAICGLGTVGSAVVDLLNTNQQKFTERFGVTPRLVQASIRNSKPKCQLDGVDLEKDIFKIAQDPRSQVLIELIGGVDDAFALTMQAFQAGKHVITANKALIAERGDELFAAAAEHKVNYYYEAAVAGGIPIIKAVGEGLAANRIKLIAGIINGTSNYILTQMSQQGESFADALKEAQKLGYAEADPTFDIDGSDAAHKITILASLAFGIPFSYDQVYKEGIEEIELEDIKWADELGYKLKHLAIAETLPDGQIGLKVHPTLVHADEAIAAVNGVLNGVVVDSEPLGRSFYSGAGAGGGATASAVMADLADIIVGPKPPQNNLTNKNPRFAGIGDSHSEFFLRLKVHDEAGVLANITEILSSMQISIEGLTQKEVPAGTEVPIIIVTHETREQEVDRAIEQINQLPQVSSKIVKLRILPAARA